MEEQNKNKKIKLDPWGKRESDELNKLRQEILKEGINKKSYSSGEESLSDSDDELLMKFIPKKKKNTEFESVAYAFTLTNKLSKLRSELARTEERMRYLQLDYNNKEIKIDEQKNLIIHLDLLVKDHIDNAKKYSILIKSQNRQIRILCTFNALFIFVITFQTTFNLFL